MIASSLFSGFLQTENTGFKERYKSGSSFGNWEGSMEIIVTTLGLKFKRLLDADTQDREEAEVDSFI